MNEVTIKQIWLAAPEITRMEIDGITDENGGKVDIGWINMDDLRIAANERLRRAGAREVNDPFDYFDRFGLLNGHESGVPKVTWTDRTHGVYKGERPPNITRSSVYVPAQWALEILELLEKGILHVEWRPELLKIAVGDRPLTYHQFIGITVGGKQKKVYRIGRDLKIQDIEPSS